MTICFFCLTLAVAVMIQFGVEQTALSLFNDEVYYAPQSETLTKRTEELTRQCGLPEEIVTGVFDSEEILAFTKEYTLRRLKGFDGELNTEPVKERLRANLYNYMDDHGISKALLDMDALRQYLSQAASIYGQTVNNGFVVNYHTLSDTVVRPAIAGALGAVLLAALCMVYMYKISGMRRKMLSYTIRAAVAVSMLCGAIAVWRFVLGGQTGFAGSPEYIAGLCRRFEDFFLKQFAAAMAVWLAVSGCLALAMMKIKHGKKTV